MQLEIYRHLRRLLVPVAIAFLGVGCSSATGEAGHASRLYEQCASCHGDLGEGTKLYKAPSIAGLDKPYLIQQLKNFQTGARAYHADDLAGLRMRPMSRTLKTDADVEVVADLITNMKPVVPEATLGTADVDRGKTLFATCAACHGQKGEGNPALKAPMLSHSNDWYLQTQIQNFRSGVRGANPADIGGAQMAPMASILPDDQAIVDVIAYIQTLRN